MKIQEIQYAKALAITLMVLCHSGLPTEQVVKFVYMFHMPLFYFVSGYCMKGEYLQQPALFVRRRFKGIYWPYLKWSLVFLAFHNAMVACHLLGEAGGAGESFVQPYGAADFVKRIAVTALTMKGHEQLLGGFWFLRTLLIGSLIAFAVLWAVNKLLRGRTKTTLLVPHSTSINWTTIPACAH